MFDAIFQLIGDLASSITDVICRLIADYFNLTTSTFLNYFIKASVYILLFIPICIGVLYCVMHLGVYLLNTWLQSS
jgi:hypothetical protein